MNHNTITSTRR